MNSPLRSSVVVGAGAVGSFFGAMLARSGHAVTLVGRAPHVQAITRDGLQLHRVGSVEAVRIAATTALDAVNQALRALVKLAETARTA